jgi:ribosome-associated translation inhibitor RaiA
MFRMKVQINTDRNIKGHEKMSQQVEAALEAAVGRFTDQITRVEVHLSDLNSDKFGAEDKRCLLEARLAGRQPTAVSHQAATLLEAIEGAAEKLKSNLESTFGRLGRR